MNISDPYLRKAGKKLKKIVRVKIFIICVIHQSMTTSNQSFMGKEKERKRE